MMNVDVNQQQRLSLLSDEEVTEETPLTDLHPNEDEEEIIPCITPEFIDWNTSLINEICREGDLHRLHLFIEYSRQMTTCGAHATQIADRLEIDTGLSPLHHAARHQQLHICLMLLSNIHFNLGVNIKDANGRTPMHSAFRSSSNTEDHSMTDITFGNQIQKATTWQKDYTTNILSSAHPLIYLFARANGDINARDKYLLTPLHYAVTCNNLSGVKQLITLNADIESQDRQGIRPLHLACKEGYLSIVEYLIECNAQIDIIDADYWTPMHHACARGHFDIVKLIHLKEKILFQELLEMKTNTDATCLHLAVQNGNIQLVEYILTEYTDGDLKVYINEQAEPFGTALHIAAKFCDPSMLNLLYDHGADPTLLNSNEQSPLHIASASNRLIIVQELYKLTQSSLLEIKDNHGQTALSVTTHSDIVDQLIAFGADITSLDRNHMNAIMIAVSTGQITIVKRLLSVMNDQLLSIVDQVEKRHDLSLFLIAVQTGSIEMCSLLLTYPYIRWDTTDRQRMNAFHIAARNGHHELIEFLCNYLRKSDRFISMKSRTYSNATTLDSDKDDLQPISSNLRLYINAQNEDGKTPLYLAAEQGHTASMQSLLNYHADVLLGNHLGQLPFHAAIQNGHSQCVELLIKVSTEYMTEFHSILSRRQSPLIIACQNGYVDIVKLLMLHEIGIHFDPEKDENPLEIAIKYRQIETLHELLEHPHTEYWLMSIKQGEKNKHQTPLRDMIRYLPDCAQHAFDRLILKTTTIDYSGVEFERTIYKYRYIDDYFLDNKKLYTTSSRQLYRNHPLIIALDREHHFLLEHPLIQQLMLHKWKIYRPLFYFSRILSFILLLILTFYVLIVPAPMTKSSSKNIFSSPKLTLIIQWAIVILSAMNLLKIFLEIILYRGFRVPFAQLFGMISFIASLLAFIPLKNPTTHLIYLQWQLTSFAVLFQWFNTAVILRSVPFLGHFLVMIESISIKLTLLVLTISPLFIAFTISTQMIFFNQPAFLTIPKALHKSSAMIIGEFDYETLFFSKTTFTAATLIFIPFIAIMAIVFMNLLLGITVGDIQGSLTTARARANAYWIRELIYIESTLPSKTYLRSNTIEQEIVDHSLSDSMEYRIDKDDVLLNHPYANELRQLLDILQTLCIQAKQVLDHEIDLERTLKQLSTKRNIRDSNGFLTVN